MNCFRTRSRDLMRSLISWFTKGHGLLRSLICFTGACKLRTDCKVSFKILSLEYSYFVVRKFILDDCSKDETISGGKYITRT